jgi:hypothetical protein
MKILNRALKLCGQVEVIGSVAVTVLEANGSNLITRFVAAAAFPTTADRFAVGAEGTLTTTGHVFRNQGTSAVPSWKDLSAIVSADMDETLVKYATGTISAADIVSTDAGKLGHANGVELVAAPGATKVIELISAVVIHDYAVAAFTAGGNVSVNIGAGGAALTGVVANSAFIGAAADKIVQLVPLAATCNQLVADKGINLVAASAFTQPGTAAGVIRYKVAYRVHTHGLA